MKTHAMIYRCPHCGQAVEVEETAVGKTVHCPNNECGNPFEVDAPRAQRVKPGDVSKAQVMSLKAESADDAVEPVGNAAEETVLVVHPAMFRAHPLRFVGLALLALLGLAGLVTAAMGDAFWRNGGEELVGESAAMTVSGLAVVAGLVLLGVWWLQTRYVTLRITTERSLLREGIISRQTSEVRHRDVRNLQIDQNILERIFSVGNVAISSAGQDEMEIFVKGIPHPDRVANHVRQLQ